MPFRDNDTDELDDREYPEPDDEEEMHLAATVRCHGCRRFMYEARERCHHCGSYRTAEESTVDKPWWVLAGVAVLLVIALVSWVFPRREEWPTLSSPLSPTSVQAPVTSLP